MRDVAERFNARFGELLVVPEHRIPKVGARIQDLQDPAKKMSTTGGSEQGTVYVLEEPDAIRRKFRRAVTDSGTEIVRADDKPGISNLIEILAAVRESSPEEVEREFASARYGDLKTAVADEVVSYLAPVRERYAAAARRRGGARARARRGRGQGARDLRARARRRARGDGRRSAPLEPPRGGRRSPPLALPPMRAAAELELDLDVFAGPFDLLLTLILREEVDLLEVELADVVLAYLDHLEARGELDLEVATEFLVLIAALLELKSRLMLPGAEEDDELAELEPEQAAEELLARLLESRRYRGAAAHLRERLAAEEGHRFRSAPLPPRCGATRSTHAQQAYDPAQLGAGAGRRCSRRRRASTSATSSRRACRWPSASRTCARCCAAGASASRTPCAAATG